MMQLILRQLYLIKDTRYIPGDLNYCLLAQDGRMLESTPPKQSATCVNLNTVTRKAGGQKQVEKQMKVIFS
jgi:hypothetical protein